jgi:D-amino-acid dehydrogenase
MPDVVVVGGGLVGAACAYELARDGLTVTVIDRHDAGRATDAGAGILSPETYDSPVSSYLALADAAGDHYRALVPALADLGVPDTGYAVCGGLRVAFRDLEDDMFAEHATSVLARRGDVLREVSVDEARAMFPPLGEIRHALVNPRAARVDGRAMVASLEHAARSLGADWRAGAVTGFALDYDRVAAVESVAGTVDCGAVVIAGGAWTDALAQPFGVRASIRPVRGQIVHLSMDADTGSWPILQPLLSHYVVPSPAGRVALGATVEDAGYDARPTAAGLRLLLSEGLRLCPGLADATFLEVRVGLRPTSDDDLPLLGRVPGVDNAYVASGHGANGLLLGPVSGRMVADLVAGRDPGVDLTPFDPRRFS